jgi:hypothetical protein
MKKVYLKDNIFIWLHITGEDSNYLHVGFFCPEDRPIPIGIEDWKEASRGSGYRFGKIRKDDPNLLEVFTYEKYRKGWYKEWRVIIRHNIGGRFWHATIGVESSDPIGDILIEQTFSYDDYHSKTGFWQGYIPCNDPELVLDPEEAVKTSQQA